MSRKIRLSSSEHRAWTQNIPQLVDEKGVPRGVISPEEEKISFEVLREAKKQRKSVRQELQVRTPGGENTRLVIEVRVKRAGTRQNDLRYFTFVNGFLRVPTREVMKARLFKKYGEAMLERPNGKFLVKLRDPNAQHTPSNQVRVGAAVKVPHPDSCQCVHWGEEPHPGKHYHICQFNATCPPEHRGVSPDGNTYTKVLKKDRRETVTQTVEEPEVMAPPTPDPAPTSADPVEPAEGVMYLYDVDTQERARKATPEEVEEAVARAERTGVPIIDIDGASYVVMSDSAEDVDEYLKGPDTESTPDGETVHSITVPVGDSFQPDEPAAVEAPLQGESLDGSADLDGLPIAGMP
jgi:hypothetical protein